MPFDPFGGDGENERVAGEAIDADAETGWNTEGYDAQDFGTKSGVGLALELAAPAEVTSVQIDSSANGWSGDVFVLDGSTPLGDFDPDTAAPAAEFRRRARAGGRRRSADATTGVRVLIWITDLGDASDDGRHRVELLEVRVFGTTPAS